MLFKSTFHPATEMESQLGGLCPPPPPRYEPKPRAIIRFYVLESGLVVALCNDETLWKYEGMQWLRLPPIPQPEASQ